MKKMVHKKLATQEEVASMIEETCSDPLNLKKLRKGLLWIIHEYEILRFKFNQSQKDIEFLTRRAETIDAEDKRGFFRKIWHKIQGLDGCEKIIEQRVTQTAKPRADRAE